MGSFNSVGSGLRPRFGEAPPRAESKLQRFHEPTVSSGKNQSGETVYSTSTSTLDCFAHRPELACFRVKNGGVMRRAGLFLLSLGLTTGILGGAASRAQDDKPKKSKASKKQ